MNQLPTETSIPYIARNPAEADPHPAHSRAAQEAEPLRSNFSLNFPCVFPTS